MDFYTKLAFVLAIGGIGVSVAVYFATYLWRDIPRWLALSGFSIGLFLCIGAVACFIYFIVLHLPGIWRYQGGWLRNL